MRKLYAALYISMLLATLTHAQIINTVAGNGTGGFSGDSGIATAAEIWEPAGITLGTANEYYIADYINNRIRLVSATGIITTFAGTGIKGYSGDGGPATAAELNNPTAVKPDGHGNIYIADAGNNRIRVVNTSTGIITTFAGTGVNGFSGDGGPATAAELNNPQCVSTSPAGDVYIADAGNNRIRVVVSGIITTGAGNGTTGYSGDGGPATAAELNNPNGMALGPKFFYFADENNNRIRAVDSAGVITTIAGNGTGGYAGDGGPATAAELNHPSGIKTGPGGINVYIADRNNNRIREVFDTTGLITTVAGNGIAGYSGDGGPAIAAELNNPTNVAIDSYGDIYIADYFNNRIREVTGVTGISSLPAVSEKVKVYPVPCNGIFNVELGAKSEGQTIEIYNVLGEKIYMTTLNTSNTQIDLSNNADGMYLYRVLTNTGVLISQGKVIIQK